jgi:hypothetical protein
MMGVGHVTHIGFVERYDEWVPTCSCGWTGSTWIRRDDAEIESEEHRFDEGETSA